MAQDADLVSSLVDQDPNRLLHSLSDRASTIYAQLDDFDWLALRDLALNRCADDDEDTAFEWLRVAQLAHHTFADGSADKAIATAMGWDSVLEAARRLLDRCPGSPEVQSFAVDTILMSFPMSLDDWREASRSTAATTTPGQSPDFDDVRTRLTHFRELIERCRSAKRFAELAPWLQP